MPNAGMRALVPPIASDPLPNGLLGGCVDVVTTTNMHELNGTDMISMSCAKSNPWQDCPAPDPDNILTPWVNPAEKLFDRPEACSFEPLTAYAGVECSTFGISFPEAQSRAMEQLRMGEQFTLEAFFMQRGLAKMALGNDLTPAGGAVHVVRAIGLLEDWLARNFSGSGLLHVPVGAASLLSTNYLVPFASDENCPSTLAGNGVVLGAGYSASVGPYTAPQTPGTAAPQPDAGTTQAPEPTTAARASQAASSGPARKPRKRAARKPRKTATSKLTAEQLADEASPDVAAAADGSSSADSASE